MFEEKLPLSQFVFCGVLFPAVVLGVRVDHREGETVEVGKDSMTVLRLEHTHLIMGIS